MKDYRQANKGMPFEQFITYANKRYRDHGEAVIWKVPTSFIPIRDYSGRIVNCKVEGKSCTDYLGRIGNRPVAIEAKHTSSDSIRWDAVQEHQKIFMDDFSKDGAGISLVVVSFKLERFFTVPWKFWEAGRTAWINTPKSKVTVEFEGTTWTTNGKASLKASDLLPEWEVKIDRLYGLDYLGVYKR